MTQFLRDVAILVIADVLAALNLRFPKSRGTCPTTGRRVLSALAALLFFIAINGEKGKHVKTMNGGFRLMRSMLPAARPIFF